MELDTRRRGYDAFFRITFEIFDTVFQIAIAIHHLVIQHSFAGNVNISAE